MNVGEIMTRPAITIREDARLGEAIRLMTGHGVSGLPVLDSFGHLVGVLTEGDLLRRAEIGTGERPWSGWWSLLRGPGLSAAEYVRAHSRRVGDLMTRGAFAVAECTPLEDAVSIMQRERIRRIPVVRDEAVLGVVSRSDVLREIGNVLAQPAQDNGDDAAILARLHAELERQSWFRSQDVTLSVQQGVVRLEGLVEDEHVRAALLVAAQNASPRSDVQDRLALGSPLPAAFAAG